jgi:hypothetical protein
MTCGFKTIENRSFKFPAKRHPMPTWIAIHASLSTRWLSEDRQILSEVHPQIDETIQGGDREHRYMGRSEIVGAVQVVGCVPIPDLNTCPWDVNTAFKSRLAGFPRSPRRFDGIPMVDWCADGFAWVIGDCYRFRRPIVALGRLNVWPLGPELQQLVAEELKWSAANQIRWRDINHRFTEKPVVFEMPKISKRQQAIYG